MRNRKTRKLINSHTQTSGNHNGDRRRQIHLKKDAFMPSTSPGSLVSLTSPMIAICHISPMGPMSRVGLMCLMNPMRPTSFIGPGSPMIPMSLMSPTSPMGPMSFMSPMRPMGPMSPASPMSQPCGPE